MRPSVSLNRFKVKKKIAIFNPITPYFLRVVGIYGDAAQVVSDI